MTTIVASALETDSAWDDFWRPGRGSGDLRSGGVARSGDRATTLCVPRVIASLRFSMRYNLHLPSSSFPNRSLTVFRTLPVAGLALLLTLPIAANDKAQSKNSTPSATPAESLK